MPSETPQVVLVTERLDAHVLAELVRRHFEDMVKYVVDVLLDLTVTVQTKRTLRRELLRWRDLVAELYVAPRPDPVQHREALRCLLRIRPEASRQIPFLLS